jgi:predicted acetyltransferase
MIADIIFVKRGVMMKDLLLVEPSLKYQKSFENYVLAYKKANDDYYYEKYKTALEDFQEFLNINQKFVEGIDIPEGWVRTSTFWLISSNEVVGVVRVRHENIETDGHIGYDISPQYRNMGYGTEILKLALEKAAQIGIQDVMVTCSVDNAASRKIIEKNNGKLLGAFFDKEENENYYKFCISIDKK